MSHEKSVLVTLQTYFSKNLHFFRYNQPSHLKIGLSTLF